MSAGVPLALGVVGALAIAGVVAQRRGSGAKKGPEHPWYAFSRWQASDHRDEGAGRVLSKVVGYDVQSVASGLRQGVDMGDGTMLSDVEAQIEDAILDRYGDPREAVAPRGEHGHTHGSRALGFEAFHAAAARHPRSFQKGERVVLSAFGLAEGGYNAGAGDSEGVIVRIGERARPLLYEVRWDNGFVSRDARNLTYFGRELASPSKARR